MEGGFRRVAEGNWRERRRYGREKEVGCGFKSTHEDRLSDYWRDIKQGSISNSTSNLFFSFLTANINGSLL